MRHACLQVATLAKEAQNLCDVLLGHFSMVEHYAADEGFVGEFDDTDVRAIRQQVAGLRKLCRQYEVIG